MTIVFDKLTAKNFQAYALNNYDDPQCIDIDDFQEDVMTPEAISEILEKVIKKL